MHEAARVGSCHWAPGLSSGRMRDPGSSAQLFRVWALSGGVDSVGQSWGGGDGEEF